MNLNDISAGEIMTEQLLTAVPAETLREAALRMHCHKTSCLLVLPQRAGQAVGVLTSKDIVKLLGHEPTSVLDELTVADAMTSPAICVQRDMGLADCINLMRMAGVRRVPVQDGSAVVGILSLTDIFERVAGGLGICAVTAPRA